MSGGCGAGGGEPYGNLYLTDKQDCVYLTDKQDGGQFSEDEHATVVLAEFAVVANDHAWRYTGSEQRCGELPAGLIGEHVALRTRSSARCWAHVSPSSQPTSYRWRALSSTGSGTSAFQPTTGL
jgi:hypothetical protein